MASEEKQLDKGQSNVTTAVEYLERQQTLEEEAGEILPWNFDQCTYAKGYIRQPVYACTTCKPDSGYGSGGVCYSCSIACHSDHDLVELFQKRSFRCDCGTARLGSHPCQLESKQQTGVNELNKYNHNYEGRFCWCGEIYDAEKEESNMHQCAVCEDWFHENCITGEKEAALKLSIPDLDSFEEYICRTCTAKFPFLKPYKHSHMFFFGQFKNTMPVDASHPLGENEVVTDSQKHDAHSETPVKSATKRKVEDIEVGSSKKAKCDPILDNCKLKKFPIIPDDIQVDLFCAEGWRDELCRCIECMSLYRQSHLEFILQEEETYEPPTDEDAQTSLFESGMKALTQMDRVTAIEGLIAYNKMRDDIRKFLQPFAESGKTVTEQDVRLFVQEKLAERKHPNTGSFF